MPPARTTAQPAPKPRPPRVRLDRPAAAKDWFVQVGGVRYPVALQRWASFSAQAARYHDPLIAEGRDATPAGPEYCEALRDGVVALARWVADPKAGGAGGKRDGFIGLYRIANVETSDDGLRFDFVERVGMF